MPAGSGCSRAPAAQGAMLRQVPAVHGAQQRCAGAFRPSCTWRAASAAHPPLAHKHATKLHKAFGHSGSTKLADATCQQAWQLGPGTSPRHCRFLEVFQEDEDGLPRTWGPKASIPAITQRARQAAAQCLALLAVRRLGLDQVSPTAPVFDVCQPSPAPVHGLGPVPCCAADGPDARVNQPQPRRGVAQQGCLVQEPGG